MSELGTIRHMVFTGEDGRPWLGRVRLVGRSPGGRRGRWELMDAVGGGVVSRDIGYGHATEEGAIDAHEKSLLFQGFCRSGDETEWRRIVAEIVAAEGLREGARAARPRRPRRVRHGPDGGGSDRADGPRSTRVSRVSSI